MDAKILKICPLSGTFEELYFDAYGETVCIKFEDQNYSEYCGIFGGGFGSKSDLAVHEHIAFIISRGQGYIFEINDRKVIYKTENDHLEGVFDTNFNNYFLAYDFTNLYIFDSKLVWSSKRISADGIEIDKIEDGIVYGKVYNFFEWVKFTLNLETFEYICDWECNLA